MPDMDREYVVGLAGIAAAVALHLSPVRWVLEVARRHSTVSSHSSGQAYYCAFYACLLWLLCLHAPPLLFVVNLFGALINLVFICVYYRFADEEERRSGRVMIILGAMYTFFSALISFSVWGNDTLLCHAAVLANIVMYLSPTTSILDALRTGSASKVQFLPLLFGFICGVIWTYYAFLVEDLALCIANASGILLGGLQLLAYIYLRTKPQHHPVSHLSEEEEEPIHLMETAKINAAPDLESE